MFRYPAPTSMKNTYKILIIHTHMVSKIGDTSPNTYSNHLPRVITSCRSPSKSIWVVKRHKGNLNILTQTKGIQVPNLCSKPNLCSCMLYRHDWYLDFIVIVIMIITSNACSLPVSEAYKFFISIYPHGIKNRWYQSNTDFNHLSRSTTGVSPPAQEFG